MERGFEQLFILALILFAAMVDLFVRWLRGKTRNQGPSEVADATEEPATADEDVIEALEIDALDFERAKLRHRTVLPREPQVSQPRPVSQKMPEILVAPRQVSQMQPVPPRRQPAQRQTRVSTVPNPRRPSEVRRWLKHPVNVRRGMVLMAILGPCRGVQSD